MAELVTDCPRCGVAQITFEIHAANSTGIKEGWRLSWEAFGVCRLCRSSTIFHLWQSRPEVGLALNNGPAALKGVINPFVTVMGYVSIADLTAQNAPEPLPNDLREGFDEAAKCVVVGCYNAAGAMFRLCLDMATRAMLPAGEVQGLNAKTRRDLGLRLPWLFNNGILPEALRELSTCIREDGNDGAHAGTLQKEDAQDLHEFAFALLDRMYSEPERLRLAKERRDQRRLPKQ